MESMVDFVKEIGVIGFLDIAFMFVLLYIVIVAFKRSRAAFVIRGILIVACIYLITRQFNLIMTATVFEMFVTIILIVLVVIFQEEIRHFFEDIAMWSLRKKNRNKQAVPLSRGEVEILLKVLMEFSREKIGALIVIRGKNMLVRHLDGEVPLDGQLSEAILKSIFDPHSVGHDGAVVIDGNRLTHFSCHLPLSKSLKDIRDRGTRHAAALGLSELTDALCLVVSEERGSISVAKNGGIKVINDPEKLKAAIESFYEDIHPQKISKPWEDILKKNSREKVYAALLAAGLWFVLVHGSKIVYRNYIVNPSYAELPKGWIVYQAEPKDIALKLKGPRTAFYLNIKDRLKFYPRIKFQEGTQIVRIYETDFAFPKGLVLEEYDPHSVKVTMGKKVKEDPPPKKEENQ